MNGLGHLGLPPVAKEVLTRLATEEDCSWHGMPAPAQAFLLSGWRSIAPDRPLLAVCPHVRWQEEVSTALNAFGVPHVFFPESQQLDGGAVEDPDLWAERWQVLERIGREPGLVVLVTETGRGQPLPKPEALREGRLELRVGQTIGLTEVTEWLVQAGYEREALVAARGQMAVRGGLADCFSWQQEWPVRIEWDGDVIESIREFDPESQLSVRPCGETVLHVGAGRSDTEGRLEDYCPVPPRVLHLGSREGVEAETAGFLEHGFLHGQKTDAVLAENRRRLLGHSLRDWLDEGCEVWISCNNEGEWQRLREWLAEIPGLAAHLEKGAGRLRFALSPLLRGFSWPEARLVVLADAEIFGRYQTLRALRHQQRLQVERRRQQAIDFGHLQLGDYVVHLEHGIALYTGMQAVPDPGGMEGERQVLVLEFHGGTKLYVPIEQAYLVSKYVGVGKRHPALDVLGGNRWEKAKAQARKAVMDYAAELLRVQAERQTMQGVASPPDTAWQREFEDAFFYEATPDQLKAIREVKADMESPRPMDRLICGDVGFGKTEVAIRAAFKAVMAGRQVAFLVPTTVLAQQHARTLRERMADYPVVVEELSRFRTKREQEEVIRKLAEGGVDIVVGTHRLISKDVVFKDLGLVIIDEEQRFGVRHKEKFKAMFRTVDVMTLSATPIPRTLYLALMGARDMSTIETAPRNRLPVETVIAAYDERLIRDAIRRELARKGQVYFLHNRVASIEGVAARLKMLVPGARIDIGHGQMDEDDLEEVMQRFVRGETDILLSTTIIESGLDIPNANTIIIDRADRFGLADLYQLRGRVGRAQSRAYALLLLPREMMGGDAKKRVQAIREYSQLGAGFKIAMRDLEIRGAGNVLGTAQSGHVTAVGFDLYCRLLKQAVARVKGEAPPEMREVALAFDFLVIQDGAPARAGVARACLPEEYLGQTSWRVAAYRELAELQNVEQWKQLRASWKDRFGRWPEPVELLLLYHRVRLAALAAGMERVEVKEDKLIMRRNGDFVMVGGKFPRLTGSKVKSKLLQVESWLQSFVTS